MTGGKADVGQTLADLLCLATGEDGEQSESPLGYLSDRVVAGAAALVDDSGLVEQWDEWYKADHPDWRTRGGRPGTYTIRQVLIVFVALVASKQPPLVSRVAGAIHLRLHTQSRDLLGLPRERDVASPKNVYDRVYRRLNWMLKLVDPFPGQRLRRISRAERDAWLAGLDPQQVEKYLGRLHYVANALLEASARLMPDDVRARWNGNICIDATLVKAWGKRGHPKPRPGRDNSADKMSPEALAGWYVRINPDTGKKEYYFGYEAHLAIMSASEPGTPADFPLLVLAMTVDKPGQHVGENAQSLLQSLHQRGHPAGTLAGDRAYFPNPQPHKLQLPARALGYRLCGDYRDDQLGILAEYGGAILVEGTWYCPSMPQPLIDATKDRRAGRIDEDTYTNRIAQRERFQFRRRHAPTPDGNTEYMCPARGPGATATCPLVPDSGPVALGLPTIPTVRSTRTRILNPPADPDRACTNDTSLTIPIAPGQDGSANIAKYFQDMPFKSPQWQATWSTLRNTIEGFNGFTKSPTEENTEEPARRRVRGYAFQTLSVALLIVASNVRKIHAWLNRRADADDTAGPPRIPARRRNARPDLADYLPSADDPPPGPLARPA